ncbi:hypothetical protein ACFQYP_39480 [Nonomuraea antimicrobica]
MKGDVVVKELLAYIRPHRKILVVGGLLSLIGSAAGLAMPLLAKYVVDAFGQDRSMAGPLLWLTVAVLVGAVVSAGEATSWSARARASC